MTIFQHKESCTRALTDILLEWSHDIWQSGSLPHWVMLQSICECSRCHKILWPGSDDTAGNPEIALNKQGASNMFVLGLCSFLTHSTSVWLRLAISGQNGNPENKIQRGAKLGAGTGWQEAGKSMGWEQGYLAATGLLSTSSALPTVSSESALCWFWCNRVCNRQWLLPHHTSKPSWNWNTSRRLKLASSGE